MRTLLIAFVAALLIAAPARAETLQKLTTQDVAAALSALNLRYVETSDNRGFPLLQVETSDQFSARSINVLFYGCDATGCDDITLYSWYRPGAPVSSDTIYGWNDIFRQARNWSRAYVDEEGDPTLVMHVNATGGIGRDALQILINTYLVESRDFGLLIGAR